MIVVVRQGFWRWFLQCTGLAAITMPWRRIYIREECADRQDIIRHELVYIEQMNRDGAVMFSVKYLWWLWRQGYWENPYEQEAYAREPGEG